MTTSPDLAAELRHAVTVIRDAACGTARTDPTAVSHAHDTLTRLRADVGGPTRAAIDTYLDANTWRQGPFVLRCAIIDLARQLGVPHSDPLDHVAEQLTLFDH